MCFAFRMSIDYIMLVEFSLLPFSPTLHGPMLMKVMQVQCQVASVPLYSNYGKFHSVLLLFRTCFGFAIFFKILNSLPF